MRLRPYTRRLGGWIAAWALMFAALAPALAQMLRVEPSPAWLEVCTPAGAKLVASDDAGESRPTSSGTKLYDHCPSCVWQHAAAAPSPLALSPLTLLPLSFGLPEHFLDAPRTPYAWAAAQPRGPPLLN